MLASCDVIKEHDLGVLLGWDLYSLGTITRWIAWVHIDNLPVTLVSEK